MRPLSRSTRRTLGLILLLAMAVPLVLTVLQVLG